MATATKLTIRTEYELGTEDRLIETNDDQWYWQARGCADAFGPFATRAEAEADYAAS